MTAPIPTSGIALSEFVRDFQLKTSLVTILLGHQMGTMGSDVAQAEGDGLAFPEKDYGEADGLGERSGIQIWGDIVLVHCFLALVSILWVQGVSGQDTVPMSVGSVSGLVLVEFLKESGTEWIIVSGLRLWGGLSSWMHSTIVLHDGKSAKSFKLRYINLNWQQLEALGQPSCPSIFDDPPRSSSPLSSNYPSSPSKYHNLDSDESASSEESLHAPGVLSGHIGPLHVQKRLAWPAYGPYRRTALSIKDERKFMMLLSRPYCGNSSDTEDGTMDQQVFSRGLERFDQDGVRYVIAYKEAAHETQRACFAVSQWEMEEASQLRRLRQYIHAKERELLNVKTEEVESFVNMLVDRDDNQAAADLDYLVTSHESERIVLDNLDKDLDTLADHVYRTGIPKLLSADSREDRSEFNEADDHKHGSNGG
ncbi:hypothetical protein F4604DRAFT_1687716 [Suillus subluteus]|nr:hypothetical protein F4604DRAFT_1687716 [Suillus subluteus]